MDIFHINVQCLSNKVDLLDSLCLNHLFLCLSEHWLCGSYITQLKIEGYSLVSFSSRSPRQHGGTAIYVHNDSADVKPRICEFINNLSVDLICELCAVESTVLNLIVVTIYRSPNPSNLDEFMDILHRLLEYVSGLMRLVVITGDFNIDINDADNSTRSFLDLLFSFGFSPTISEPTRLRRCLDNIFCNFDELYFDSYVNYDCNISDHSAVVIEMMMNFEQTVKQHRLIRPYTNEGLFLINSLIQQVDWQFVYDDGLSIDYKFEKFIGVIKQLIYVCFPERKMLCSKYSFSLNWFNSELADMRENLRFMTDVFKVTGDAELRTLMKSYKSRYRSRIAEAKRNATETYINSSNNKSYATWKVVNSYRHNLYSSCESELTADQFNNYFVNIPLQITRDLPDSFRNLEDHLNISQINCPVFSFKPVTNIQIIEIIRALKNSHCRDIYGINSKILKSILYYIVSPLTSLFNMCLASGIYPSCLKKSRVVPIYKKGDTNLLNNYRPVSITPIFSKVLENALRTQIVAHFESHALFNSVQFGFRSGRSTVSAINQLLDLINNAFKDGLYVGVTFCDLSKAFDCANVNILCNKLKLYNFSDHSVSLIESFLSERSQYVAFRDRVSDFLSVSVGVPQGSVLGPVLFLVYINDLPGHVPDTSLVLYADDTTTCVTDMNYYSMLTKMETAHLHLDEWLCGNKLVLNEAKTVKVCFSLRNIPDDELPSVSHCFLGLNLDNHLIWQLHCEKLANSLASNVYLLRTICQTVSKKTLLTLYYAIVHSKLSYALICWGHASAAGRIFGLQRRAIRILDSLSYRADCRNSFVKLGILTLPSLYILLCLLHVKVNMDKYPLRSGVHEVDTRHRDDIDVDFHRLSRTKCGINYWGPHFYNKLPMQIRELDSQKFKTCVKKYLSGKCYYSFKDFLKDDVRDFVA